MFQQLLDPLNDQRRAFFGPHRAPRLRWRPHFVVVLFGTNDAKPENWDAEAFQQEREGRAERAELIGRRVCISCFLFLEV